MATSNQSTFSRRDFIVTLLSTGFALAVRPVSAQTIITDSNKLVTKEIKITVPDGEIPAYLAHPESGSSFPVILVV